MASLPDLAILVCMWWDLVVLATVTDAQPRPPSLNTASLSVHLSGLRSDLSPVFKVVSVLVS